MPKHYRSFLFTPHLLPPGVGTSGINSNSSALIDFKSVRITAIFLRTQTLSIVRLAILFTAFLVYPLRTPSARKYMLHFSNTEDSCFSNVTTSHCLMSCLLANLTTRTFSAIKREGIFIPCDGIQI